VITESSQQFGGNTISFANKKNAKRYAAKKAVDWLIENKYMPADGSIKFPKAPPPPPAPKVKRAETSTSGSGSSSAGLPTTTAASQVPILCNTLGFTAPRYTLTQENKAVPLYDGYADFQGDPRIDGPVGKVMGVFGQKRAKEQIAEQVLSFLKDIERQRKGEILENDDKKRKRDQTGSPS